VNRLRLSRLDKGPVAGSEPVLLSRRAVLQSSMAALLAASCGLAGCAADRPPAPPATAFFDDGTDFSP